MKPFVDIEIETTNPTGAINRLHSMGLSKGDGIRLFSGMLESVDNLFYFTFRVWEDRVHVIPKNNNPVFTILWRSDAYDEEGSLKPWPLVTVERPELDEDGIPTGQMIQNQQGVGRIQ